LAWGGDSGIFLCATSVSTVSPYFYLFSFCQLAELLRVLTYPKFRLSPDEREELLGDFLPFAEIVDAGDAPNVVICRDPDDRIFLELASMAGVDVLVTGDSDLLVLSDHFRIPILTPAKLLERL